MSRQMPWSLPLFKAPLDRWQERDGIFKDGVLALTLTLLAFVPTLSNLGAQIGDLPERPANMLGVGLVLSQTLPLTVRRKWPAISLAVIAGAFAAHQALGFGTTFASLGLYLALYSAGAHPVRFRHALAVVASTGYAVLAVVLDHRPWSGWWGVRCTRGGRKRLNGGGWPPRWPRPPSGRGSPANCTTWSPTT
ncbi:DUF7134 domain-containing protein [Streptomyces sp. NBC_01716]|uniref:DUF7134 domain-containing protein n=1 Tax=Streptomyces sp. NBC_01716 TaxID=2975917 RepID=UPI002E37C81E|nr:hypothetical protein [Streptomyces sp. NBC_01716]